MYKLLHPNITDDMLNNQQQQEEQPVEENSQQQQSATVTSPELIGGGNSILGASMSSLVDMAKADYTDILLEQDRQRQAIPTDEELQQAELASLTDEELNMALKSMLDTGTIPDGLKDKMPVSAKLAQEQLDASAPKSLFRKAVDVPIDAAKGVFYGAGLGVMNLTEVTVDALNWLDDATGFDVINNTSWNTLKEGRFDDAKSQAQEAIPDSAIGSVSGTMSQYAVGYAASGAIMSGVKSLSAGRALLDGAKALMGGNAFAATSSLTKSAFSTGVAFDEDDPRFADLFQKFPALKNPVTDYLASNPSDSSAEKRFKQVLDAVLGDVATGLTLKALGKAFKFLRGSKDVSKVATESATDAITSEAVDSALLNSLKSEADEALEAATKESDELIAKASTINNTEGVVVNHVDDTVSNTQPKGKNRKSSNSRKTSDKRAGTVLGDRNNSVGNGNPILPAQQADGALQVSSEPLLGTTPPLTNEDALLEEAQRLYADGVANSGARPEFRPTRDIINVKHIDNALLSENGAAKLLQLGNDMDANVLGRQATEVTTKPLAETLQEAKDIIKAYTDDTVKLADLENLAGVSETLATKVVVARDMVAQGAGTLGRILDELNQFPIEDMASRQSLITNKLRPALRNYATAATFMDKISTGIGRGLNAFKVMVGDIAPVGGGLGDTLADTVSKLGKTLDNMSDDAVLGLSRRIKATPNPVKAAKLLQYTSATTSQKVTGMVTEYWMNSILSGVPTHAANVIGNSIQLGIMMPLDNLARGWGFTRGGLFSIHNREAWNQGVYAWWSLAQSFKESWSMSTKAFKLGANILKADNSVIESQMRKISSQYLGIAADSKMGKFVDTLGKVFNIPTRFLMSADELSAQLAYRSDVRIHLLTKAKELYAKGAGTALTESAFVNKYIKDNFDSFFTDAISGSGAVVKGGTGAFKQGLEHAMEATFSKPLREGSISRALQQTANKHPMVQHLMPFVRTPANILNETMMRIPGLNLLSGEFHAARRAGGEAWERAQAKLIVGTAFCGVAVSSALTGSITGEGPRNKAQREALMATGWRPYSIKAGDTYISYARLEPIGSLFGIAATASELYTAMTQADDANDDTLSIAGQLFNATIFAAARNLSSKSYLSGVGNFLEALESEDPSKINAFVSNYVASYVPNVGSSITKTYDPTIREVRGVFDRMASKIPGYSETLPAKYSWLTGQPIQYTGGMASGFSPVVYESDKKDPVLTELSKLSSGLTFPSPRVNGVKLDARQISDYYRLHGSIKIDGKTMLEALSDVIMSPDYASDNPIDSYDNTSIMDSAQLKKVSKIISIYRDRAKLELTNLYPDELKEKQKELKKAAATRALGGARNASLGSDASSQLAALAKF